ncbi:pyridoxamine 5'-phosphate oxidase family protein [Blastococcus atacamensis]|uniref:pyridoxamine 5'-phosphate oxidase family protein n=1 Tax=Blastococcus atacamensis TaxID=2070508 RepID=UPI000CEBC98C|nr:pyridoxamine 5'-phosphate oxidase family protein [Blastococcus atacamensis]
MFSADHDRTLEVLDEEECRRLLGTAVIGRLALTERALPTIHPVHFVVAGDRLVIPTRMGSKAAFASRGAVVAFEADDFDPAGRVGWNVTVIGPSRVVVDPAEIAVLDGLGVRAWAPSEQPCYITVQLSLVQGRRITVTAHGSHAGPEVLLAGSSE